MKTLIVHPADPTTDFLTEIYKGIDCTVIRDLNVTKKLLKAAIKSHDRIIFLGHGDAKGLYGKNRYIIDSHYVYLLRDKHDVVYIWCHAKDFCDNYGLKGFKTGMIISDYEEALLYCVKCTGDDIDQSNSLFALSMKSAMTIPLTDLVSTAKQQYIIDTNPVIEFNQSNLHYS